MTAEHEFRQQPKPSEIALPDKLAKIKKADDFPAIKYKWNTNEEVLSLLTSLSNHDAWVTREVADRPQNGSMFLFDRSKVKHYRKDGYTWKKRRSGNTIREDHTRLKVEGIECLSVLYTHSALVPTFHRRCYWLLQNPQIVLVHYLNLVEECSKPITVSVYMSPDSHDDISQQLKAIYSGVSQDVKPEVTVSEESPPASPSSSEEGDTSSTKGKQQQKRNKAIYKISISPNKSLQAVPQNDKLSLKVMKVTRNEQGRLTVTGHREGSPSLDEDNSSHEGNDSGRTNERGQSTCQSVVTSASTRDNHVFATCAQNFFNQQSPRDVSILSAVPMVTNPPVSALSCAVQNTVSTTTVTTVTNSQLPQQNHASNAISINPLSRETSSNSGIQWNSVFVHPRLAELSSSPSSDYGSYMSDAGTRLSFSGSDSLSGGLSAQSFPDSDQAMFDGPFRLPLPVTRDCPPNFADSAKSDQGLSQGMCWLADCSPGASQSSGNDVPDFSPLELLGFDDMFDCNLSNVIPECLNSPPKQSENVAATSVGENLHPTYSTALNTSTQSSSLTLNSFSAESLVSQPPQTFHVTTSGLSSTTSYVFVKPASPVRNTVVTSCFVSVSNNTPSTSSGVSVCRASTQSLPGGQRESNEVTVPDICMTPVISQPTSNQVAHGSSAKTNSNHQSLSSDINNNTSRPIDAGETTTFTSSLHPRNHVVPGSARITDFSPEWCYPEGGAKVLITGEWRTEQGVYTCLFDGCSVPAILYQAGVLRCFCPSHDPGLVTLQVACNGFIVSNACVFEYRARDSPAGSSGCHEWLTTDNDRFKLALLDRLERLESRLNASQTNNSESQSQGNQCMTFEDRLIAACEIFHRSNCPIRNLTKIEKPFRGMTLLHLSAALGYNRLVCTLLKFWRESQSALVRDELNPLRKDEFACTPLTWACALGWTDAALMLLETEPKALLEPDARGRMPLQLARDRGFLDVVDIIEDSVTSFPNRNIFLGVGHDSDVTSSPMASSCESSPQPSALAPQSRILLAPPVDTTMEERAGSPMFVDEDEMEPQFSKKPGNTLAKTLVHIHSMISEAEQEAELGHRIPGHLSPLHENTELVTGSWSSAMRLRTFSSASSQSSPLTPCSSKSSLSPGSPGFLNSPHSSPIGPDTTEFQEFIYSSRKLLERDLSDLTLTDREQWELYEAAKIIQSAYRNYKTRRHQQEQEIEAAILIQHHYRRYKEYIAFKKMTRAALIIQNQYRTHREHERFKKSRRAAAIIQNTFRSYRERRRSTQRRREQRLSKRQEARYIQKASNSDGLDRIVKQAHSPSKPQNKKYGKDRRTTPNT